VECKCKINNKPQTQCIGTEEATKTRTLHTINVTSHFKNSFAIMIKKILYLVLLIVIVCSGCKRQIIYDNDQNDQFYSLINDFLIDTTGGFDQIKSDRLLNSNPVV
jgi:hypothetical protein